MNNSMYGNPFYIGDNDIVPCASIITFSKASVLAWSDERLFAIGEGHADNGYYTLDKDKIISAYPNAKAIYFNIPTGTGYLKKYKGGEKASIPWLIVTKDNLVGSDFEKDLLSMNDGEIIVRDFFSDEVDDTIKKVNAHTDSPCLVYSIITDTHEDDTNSNSIRRTQDMVNNVRAVNKGCFLDAVVHLGDLLVADTSKYQDYKTATNQMTNFVNRLRLANNNVFVTIGNHDGKASTYPDHKEAYTAISRMNEGYVHRDGINAYYYIDYSKINLRCMFLSTNHVDDIGNVVYGWSSEEVSWFENALVNTPNNYNILVFAHIQPYESTIRQGKDILTKMKTFNLHTGAFSEKTGRIKAYICGHSHCDNIIRDNSVFTEYDLDFPIIQIGCSFYGGNSNPPSGATTPSRTDFSVTQDLWDTMIYRPDLNKIYMVRFGAGEDREIDL